MTGEFSLAVHALVYLHHKGTTLSSEALAENICTNPARVRKIMALLKRAGLLATKGGAEGGYSLVGDGGEITLRQVAEAVRVSFVSASWKSGSIDMECLVASGMGAALDGIYDELDAMCYQRLDTITIESVEQAVFARIRPDAPSASLN